MDKAKKDRLTAAGIDVDGALERFMNNEALLERFLRKFPADPNYEKLTAAFATGDHEEALTASHTLKGMCGNLSLVSRQVELLRAEDWNGAAALLPEIGSARQSVLEAIEEVWG
jgi:HPt (histidine-containing phosphotransfer) domain-containing protein